MQSSAHSPGSTPGLLSVCALMVSIAITGCTTVHKDFRPFSPEQDSHVQTKAKVAIILSDELCSLYYKPRDFQEFSLGPVVCENARIAARATFDQPLFVGNEKDAASVQADYIGILRSRDVWLHVVKEIPARVITGTLLTWELRSGDGRRLYGATVRGGGEDRRTFGLSDVRYESSMQECMDDLAANVRDRMAEATQRAARNAAASNRIREAIEGFRTGVTTYADYRGKKDGDWHVFAVLDLARYDDRDYSYLLDPEINQHISSIGTWTTKWVKYLPVTDALRPSVYLPDSRIDHSKIRSVYIKELVGSVHDDHPLCELVFEGDDFGSLILKECSCQRDYLAAGTYMSVDPYKGQTPNETVQNWLKLRPGMSENEVKGLIGEPQRSAFSSASGESVYEYGYGRIRFNRNGLSNWRLD